MLSLVFETKFIGDQAQLNTYAYYNTATQAPQSGVSQIKYQVGLIAGGKFEKNENNKICSLFVLQILFKRT